MFPVPEMDKSLLQRHTLTFLGHLSFMCIGVSISSQDLTDHVRKSMNPSCVPLNCRAPHDVSEGVGEKEAQWRVFRMYLDVFWIITKEFLPLFVVL